MEPVGLGLGVVGALGPLLEVLDRIKTYRSFETDVGALTTEFEASRLLYERDKSARLRQKGGTVPNNTRKVPALNSKTAAVVQDLHDEISHILQLEASTKSADAAGGGSKTSKRRRLAWAFGGKQDRQDQLAHLDKLSLKLHHLLEPASSQSQWQTDLQHALDEIRQDLAETQAIIRKEVHAWFLGQHIPSERYEDSLQRKLPGTCTWILTHPAFVKWKEGGPLTHGILWIHGPPGFGKTILCSHIVEYLLESGQRLPRSSFRPRQSRCHHSGRNDSEQDAPIQIHRRRQSFHHEDHG